MTELKSLTLNGIKYDSFVDATARETTATPGEDGLSMWAATVGFTSPGACTIQYSDILTVEGRSVQLNDLILFNDGIVGKVVEVYQTDTRHTVTAEDTGICLQGIQGEAGDDGYTPVKGTDYWTEADKTGIVNELSSISVPKNQGVSNVGKILVVGADGNLTLTDMPSGEVSDIIGTVGENNAITITGDLADGTYIFRYENTDGSYTDIGTLIVGGVVEYSITANLTECVGASNNATVIEQNGTATLTFTANNGFALTDTVEVIGADYTWDSEGGILTLSNPTTDITIAITATKSGYTNIINPEECSDNSRLSVSSGETRTLEGYVVSPMLYTGDYTKPITFRTQGVDFNQTNSNIVLYYEDTEVFISGVSFSQLIAATSWNGWSCTLDGNGNLTLVFDSSGRYKFKICGMGSSENFVMTANEEITE